MKSALWLFTANNGTTDGIKTNPTLPHFMLQKVIFYAAKGNLLRPKMRHIGNTLTIMQLEQAIITPVRQAKPPLN